MIKPLSLQLQNTDEVQALNKAIPFNIALITTVTTRKEKPST